MLLWLGGCFGIGEFIVLKVFLLANGGGIIGTIFIFSTFMKGFIDFIRNHSVVGLAVGFILGGAISRVASAMTADILYPLLGSAISSFKGIESFTVDVLGSKVLIGHFIGVLLDFMILLLVVYLILRMLGLDRLYKKN